MPEGIEFKEAELIISNYDRKIESLKKFVLEPYEAVSYKLQ